MIYKLEFREGSSMYVKEKDIQDIEGVGSLDAVPETGGLEGMIETRHFEEYNIYLNRSIKSHKLKQDQSSYTTEKIKGVLSIISV